MDATRVNASEQVQAALALQLALANAGLKVREHHQEGGRGSYEEADPVKVVGHLARGGFWLCKAGTCAEVPTAARPDYIRLVTDDRIEGTT